MARRSVRLVGGGKREAGSTLSRIRSTRDLGLAVALLYVLLSILVGFAHRPIVLAGVPGTSASVTGERVAAVLCLGGAADERGSGHAGPSICDACLITGAPGLVAAPPHLPLRLGARLDAPLGRRDGQARSSRPALVAARGPPDRSSLA